MSHTGKFRNPGGINTLIHTFIFQHIPNHGKALLMQLSLLDTFTLEQAIYITEIRNPVLTQTGFSTVLVQMRPLCILASIFLISYQLCKPKRRIHPYKLYFRKPGIFIPTMNAPTVYDTVEPDHLDNCNHMLRSFRSGCVFYGLTLIKEENWLLLENLADEIKVPYSNSTHIITLLYAEL